MGQLLHCHIFPFAWAAWIGLAASFRRCLFLISAVHSTLAAAWTFNLGLQSLCSQHAASAEEMTGSSFSHCGRFSHRSFIISTPAFSSYLQDRVLQFSRIDRGCLICSYVAFLGLGYARGHRGCAHMATYCTFICVYLQGTNTLISAQSIDVMCADCFLC